MVRVVQFTVPKTLDIWMQRGGRAGRDRSIRAEAILLVQPSIFQEISNKKGNTSLGDSSEATESPQYQKEINDGLRQWIEAVICRRDVVDEYYDSGVPRSGMPNHDLNQHTFIYTLVVPLGICCDNCQRKAAGSESSQQTTGATDPDDGGEDADHTKDQADSDVASDTAPDDCVPQTKRRDPTILPQRRRGAHLVDAQTSLERWRAETWTRQYAGRPWSPEIILPSRVVSNIANKTNVQSTEALVEIGGWARHRALVHGDELLCILREVDERERDRRASEKQKKVDERLERKRAAEAVREAKKAETKRRREEVRLNRPKKPRLSRAKVAKHVAAGIGLGKENIPPLSAPPVSVLLPTASWPMIPFTPPRPTSPAGSTTSMQHQFAPPPVLSPVTNSPYPMAAGNPTSPCSTPSQQLPASFWMPPYLPPPHMTSQNLQDQLQPIQWEHAYPTAMSSGSTLSQQLSFSPASFWTPPYLPPHMTSHSPPDTLQPIQRDSSQYPTAAMNGIDMQTLARYYTWPQ